MRFGVVLVAVFSLNGFAETCSSPPNSSTAFLQTGDVRNAWMNTINAPSRRFPAGSQAGCNPTTSYCFPAAAGRLITLSEFGVERAKAPEPASATINFPADIRRDLEQNSAAVACADSTNANPKYCNARELFRLLSRLLVTNYASRSVRVVIARGEYQFEPPATAEEVRVPSIKLQGLRNVEIIGEGPSRPLLKFSNPMASGIEISDCKRLTLKDLELDYDFDVPFNDWQDTTSETWFRRIPYGAPFVEGRMTSDSGHFELIAPTAGVEGLEKTFRAAFLFWLNPADLSMPGKSAPHYYSREAATGLLKGEMYVFGTGRDDNRDGTLSNSEVAVSAGSEAGHYYHPSLRGLAKDSFITLGRRRDGYQQAVYVRDAVEPDWELKPNEDIIFDRVRLNRYPQMGFVFQGGSRVRLSEVFIFPPGNERHSGRADALHLQGVSDLELRQSLIAGQGDDGLNIRGVTAFATSLSYGTCRRNASQTQPTITFGFEENKVDSVLFAEGDEVALVTNQGVPVVSGQITKLARSTRHQRPVSATIEVTRACDDACMTEMKRVIGASAFSSHVPVALFNLSRSGARYYITGNNRFMFSASRGLLINSPHGVIEDSQVRSMPGSGIRLLAENNAAGITGPGAANVLVRRNAFNNVNFDDSSHPLYLGAIAVGTPDGGATTLSAGDAALESPLVQRILLQDNEVFGAGHAALTISRASRVEASWSNPSRVYLRGCYRSGPLDGRQWGSTDAQYRVPVATRKATALRILLQATQYADCGTL